MAPNSKPPSSHQTRPPLASRIRASFEGKRSKSLNKGNSRPDSRSENIASPTAESHGSPVTNGFLPSPGLHDADTLRSAVDQAINSDAFQGAIAAHLAKLIKPSIKSALDTIQPLVEAVYTHELLLRKTNQNVENALERMETNTSRRASKIDLHEGGDNAPEMAEHSRSLEVPVSREVAMGGLAPDIDQFKQLLEENNARTATAIAELSSSVQAGNTKIAQVAEQVMDIRASLAPTRDGIETLKTASEESSTTVSVLQAQLDQLSTDITQILDAIGSDLGKNVQAIHERGINQPDASFLSEHTTKLDAISTHIVAMKGHGDTTDKFESISSELAALMGTVETGIISSKAGFSGLEAQITTVLSAIEGQTTLVAELNEKPAHPDLVAAIQESNDLHASHRAALEELKGQSLASNRAVVTEHGESDAVATALSDLKSELVSVKEGLELAHSSRIENASDLGTRLDDVLSSLERHKASSDTSAGILAAVQQSNESHVSHTAAFEVIKSQPPPSVDISGLESQVATMIETLDAHTSALEDIKTASGGHTAALETHSSALAGLRSVNPDGPSARADENANLEPHLATIISTLQGHSAHFEELKTSQVSHAAARETHGRSLETITASNETSGSVGSPIDLSALEAQVASVVSTLEDHSAALNEIKGASVVHTNALEGHSVALEDIKSISGAPVAEGGSLADLEVPINTIHNTLLAHTSILEELKGATSSHASILAERPIDNSLEESHFSELEARIGSLAATLESHGSILDEIKSTGGSHGIMLDEIKTAHTTHASALDEIKTTTLQHGSLLEEIRSPGLPPMAPLGLPDTSNLAALEIQVGSIITTLSTHTSALANIGTRVGASDASLLSASDEDVPRGDLNTVLEILDAHTAVLNEIKEDVSAEILTALHNLDQKQENCTNLLVEIREADVTEEVLTLLHGLSETASTHATGLEGIQEVVKTSQGMLEETISRDIPSSDNQVSTHVDTGALEAQLTSMLSVLEDHKTSLSSIKDATTASHDLHIAHGSSLEELKSRSIEPESTPAIVAPQFEDLKTRLDGIVSALDEHKLTLFAIETATSASHDLHSSHAEVLEELKSRSIEPAPAVETSSFDNMESKIDDLISSLAVHNATLSTIKEMTGATHELNTSHVASLDEIKSRYLDPTPTPEAPDFSGLETQLTTIATSLEEHKAILSSLQDSHSTHTTSLNEIKSRSVESASGAEMPDITGLEGQINGVISSLEEHKSILSSIQESHSSHAVSLDELKARSIDPDHINGIVASLVEQKASLETIQETATATHGLNVAHATSLEEVKSRALDSVPDNQPIVNTEELGTQMESIIATLEEQRMALHELKDMTSGFTEAQVSHTTILNDIKDGTGKSNESHTSHAIMLNDLKAIPEPASPDLSAIEAHLNMVITTLESHTETLTLLKDNSTIIEVQDVVNQSHELLNTNHKILNSLTEGPSQEDIAASLTDIKSLILESKSGIDTHTDLVKDLHSSTTESHSTLTTAIAALAVGGAAGAGATALLSHDDESSAEVLAEVKAVRAIVEGSREDLSSMRNQIDINHTTITTSLSSLGDEVKAEIDASGTGVNESLNAMHEDIKGIDLSVIREKLEEHEAQFKGISSQLENIDESVKAVDLAPVHATLEQHGSDVRTVVTHLEGIGERVNAIDLTPVHAAFELHGAGIDGIYTQLENLNDNVGVVDLAPVHAALEQHGNDVKDISMQLSNLDGKISENRNQLQTLHSGVHLNDTGLEQLQSQVVTRKVSNPILSEGAWFKRDKSLSPVAERNTPVDDNKDHSSIPGMLAGVVAGGAVIGGAAALLSKDDSDVDDIDEEPSTEKELGNETFDKDIDIKIETPTKPHDVVPEAKTQPEGHHTEPVDVTSKSEHESSREVADESNLSGPESVESEEDAASRKATGIEEEILETASTAKDTQDVATTEVALIKSGSLSESSDTESPAGEISKSIVEPAQTPTREKSELDPEESDVEGKENDHISDESDAEVSVHSDDVVVREAVYAPKDVDDPDDVSEHSSVDGLQTQETLSGEEKLPETSTAELSKEEIHEIVSEPATPTREPADVSSETIDLADADALLKKGVLNPDSPPTKGEIGKTEDIEPSFISDPVADHEVSTKELAISDEDSLEHGEHGILEEPILASPQLEEATLSSNKSQPPRLSDLLMEDEPVELPETRGMGDTDVHDNDTTGDSTILQPSPKTIPESSESDDEGAHDLPDNHLPSTDAQLATHSNQSEDLSDLEGETDVQIEETGSPTSPITKEESFLHGKDNTLSKAADLDADAIDNTGLLRSNSRLEESEHSESDESEDMRIGETNEEPHMPSHSQDVSSDLSNDIYDENNKSIVDTNKEPSQLSEDDEPISLPATRKERLEALSDDDEEEYSSEMEDDDGDLVVQPKGPTQQKDLLADKDHDNSKGVSPLSNVASGSALAKEIHHIEDDNDLPDDYTQQVDESSSDEGSDEDATEGDLSPILDSSDINIETRGVKKPSSDTHKSDPIPSPSQVHPLSYPSAFSTSSPMSESYPLEPQLRETVVSQLDTLPESKPLRLGSAEPPSSPFVEHPGATGFSPERNTEASPTQRSYPSRGPLSPYHQLPRLITQFLPTTQEPQSEDDSSSPPAPQIEDGSSSPLVSQTDQRATGKTPSPSPITPSPITAQQPQYPSHISTSSTNSAVDLDSPEGSSPLGQQIHSRITNRAIHSPERQARETTDDHGGFSSPSYYHSSEAQSSSPAPVTTTKSYSRRSTLEQDHAVPNSAPGAEYQAPSITESHYSISEHPHSNVEPDRLSPLYSPTDVVNQYGDYPSPLHGQSPFESSHAEHPETIQARSGNNMAGEHFQTDVMGTQPMTSSYGQYPEYASHSIERESHELDFGMQGSSPQYARYTEERSPSEPSPYSQEGLLDRVYDDTPVAPHRSQYTGDPSNWPGDQTHEHFATHSSRYLTSNERQRISGEEQQYSSSQPTSVFEQQDDDQEYQESPPDTGHFQQQFGSSNRFATGAAIQYFEASSSTAAYEEDFASPRSNDRFLDDEDVVDHVERLPTRELQQQDYNQRRRQLPPLMTSGFEHGENSQIPSEIQQKYDSSPEQSDAELSPQNAASQQARDSTSDGYRS